MWIGDQRSGLNGIDDARRVAAGIGDVEGVAAVWVEGTGHEVIEGSRATGIHHVGCVVVN